jgi:tRNA pseudouridine65 synthase
MRLLLVDDVLAVCDKPSGMLVHNGWARAPVVAVGEARRLVGRFVHPVHRLDRGASGVLVFALDKETAAALHAMFEDGRVDKRYLALVRGVAPDEGVIDHPIPRREDGPRVPAVTSFRRIAVSTSERLSLVEARPRTGRLHQVRRHLKHIGHPIIGDANYGKGELNRDLAARHGLARLALHAASVELDHPATGARLRVEAPLPEDLRGPLVRMGFPGVE